MLKLISATPSPYARKVRIALAEKNIPFELITEVPWNKGALTEQHNPLAKLPVLMLEDGSTVYDSRFILEYLEYVYTQTPLLSSKVPQRLMAKKLEVLADGVCDAVVLVFFERMRGEHASAEWTVRQAHKIEAGVRELARLIEKRPFAVGDQFGLADIAVGAALGYLKVRFTDFDWQTLYPSLASYSANLEKRPSFQSTQPYPQTITDKVV
jgi:glutathione S-transferase